MIWLIVLLFVLILLRVPIAFGLGFVSVVGIMLTNKGEGHGAYGGNGCVTSTIDDYFLDGKVPADGKTCG